MKKTTLRTFNDVAFVAALAWGVWTVVPVALAIVAAFIVIVGYGFVAFTVPPWALAVGAVSTIVVLSTAVSLRNQSAKKQLMQKILLVMKISAVLFVTFGALAAVLHNMPPLEIGPKHVVEADNNLRQAAFGLTEFCAWIVLVVLPVFLCLMAIQQFWDEVRKSRA